MSEPRPQRAFVAAALVLLVLPFVTLVGLQALGLATLVQGSPIGWFIAAAILWSLLVVAIVLVLVRRVAGRPR